MAFEAFINGGLVEVDNVQVELEARGLKANSFVSQIRFLVNSPDDENHFDRLIVSVRKGIQQQETIIADLYTAAMESGNSQFIYDGLNAFQLEAKGIGSWQVVARLRATVKNGDGRPVTLDEVTVRGERWNGAIPYPSEKKKSMTEEFNQAVAVVN